MASRSRWKYCKPVYNCKLRNTCNRINADRMAHKNASPFTVCFLRAVFLDKIAQWLLYCQGELPQNEVQ